EAVLRYSAGERVDVVEHDALQRIGSQRVYRADAVPPRNALRRPPLQLTHRRGGVGNALVDANAIGASLRNGEGAAFDGKSFPGHPPPSSSRKQRLAAVDPQDLTIDELASRARQERDRIGDFRRLGIAHERLFRGI